MRWTIWIVILALGLTMWIFSAAARASQLYQMSGEVVNVTPRTVVIRNGTKIMEFTRPKHLGFPKKGDRITIKYHLDAEQILPAPQEGGSVPGVTPGPVPSDAPGVPGIIDDRAFYNAKTQTRPTRKNPS